MSLSSNYYFSLVTRFTFVFVLLAFSGCGAKNDQKPTAEVKGAITYKGKPLERGEIIFFPNSGAKIATGIIQSDGTFQLTTYAEGDGALLGSHQVAIKSERDMEGILPEDPEASMEPSLIPTKYAMKKTSGLTAEVKDGDNEINFDLK